DRAGQACRPGGRPRRSDPRYQADENCLLRDERGRRLSTRRPSVDHYPMTHAIGDPALASRLRRALRGEVLFDPFTRGRYSTDASIYQIEPIGVALPQDTEDIVAAVAIAREEGFPLIPRGGGSSQNGQTLGRAVVMDTSRHMNRILEIDAAAGTAVVQPGIV